ncbi:MAG: hypothetical protein ACREV8_17910 [Gammaproteobacteria bacterium]
MSGDVLVAVIAAGPPTLAAILGYLANSRSIRRSVGSPAGMPLARVIERVEDKIDRLSEGHAAIRERLANLEAVPSRRSARRRA